MKKKIDLFLGLLSINYFYILVVLENVYKKKVLSSRTALS